MQNLTKDFNTCLNAANYSNSVSAIHSIYIVSRQPLIRRAFTNLINEFNDCYLAGEHDCCSELLHITESVRTSIIFLDLDEETPSTCKRLCDRYPESKIIIYSAFDQSYYGKSEALERVCGYLSKYTAIDNVRQCLQAVIRQHTYIDPAVSECVITSHKEHSDSTLSTRELTVIQLIAKGMRNKEIARDLFITERTVKFHVSQIFKKLHVKNRTEAVHSAVSCEIV